MEARRFYSWAQSKIDDVTGIDNLSRRRHREIQANERRLRQLEERRRKNAKREQAKT